MTEPLKFILLDTVKQCRKDEAYHRERGRWVEYRFVKRDVIL